MYLVQAMHGIVVDISILVLGRMLCAATERIASADGDFDRCAGDRDVD